MEYREFRPAADLRISVNRYWSLTGELAACQTIVPDGHPELVLHLGDPLFRVGADGLLARQPGALFVGQMRGPVWLQAVGSRVDVWGIRFHPHGARALMGCDQRDLTGQMVETGGDLRERLGEVAGCAERVAVTDAWLRHAIRGRQPNERVARAVVLLSEARRVEEVASEVCWSRRQLERVFAAEVGLGPKAFARLARFQFALRASERLPWADVAAEAGYVDQAHLIADFREFAGEPPLAARESLAGMGSALVRA